MRLALLFSTWLGLIASHGTVHIDADAAPDGEDLLTARLKFTQANASGGK